jgi:dTMP kinase
VLSGKLIVFEGTDGSGKATQTELLCRELERRGTAYRRLTFPRYQDESSALIRLYLNGAFGNHPDDVNAYAAATFFAVDRYASYKQDWGSFYQSGGLLVADRYTTSNAVHQTVKLPPEERVAFLDWLFDFEYRLLGLPAPTRVLYLDIPTELTERMMRRRERETNTKADIHERDEAYLRLCRENAAFVTEYCGWTKIDCTDGGALLPAEEIHRIVLGKISDLL